MGFDAPASFVVGDKPCDSELGQRAGATTFLVRSGYGSQFRHDPQAKADHTVADGAEAAEVILNLVDQN